MTDTEIIEINRLRKAYALADTWRELGYGANELADFIYESGLFRSSGMTHERERARTVLSRLLTAASARAGRPAAHRWEQASKATWDITLELLRK